MVGGLIISLGCLFTSFATQFHQIYISYGLLMAAGFSMTQNSFMLMLGQYFKKRRELVEVAVVSGQGAGILVMSNILNHFVRKYGWRLGLQAVTLSLVSIFFIGKQIVQPCPIVQPSSVGHPPPIPYLPSNF